VISLTHNAESVMASPAVRDGMRTIVPMTIGVAPFGLVLGATVAANHIDPIAGLGASILVVAGSAQLSTLDLISRDAMPIVTIAAALLINLRFLAYSAGMATWFPTSTRRQRIAIAYPLVDQLYLAVATDTRWEERTEPERRRFYAGAAGLLVTVWVLSQLVGYAVGGAVPECLSLEAAAPLSLAGLLAKAAVTRHAQRAAVTAAVLAATATPLVGPASVIVAIAVAAATSTDGEQ
jgi:predicted branched-subunit amino acid permease